MSLKLGFQLLLGMTVVSCQTSTDWSATDLLLKGDESFQVKERLTTAETKSDVSFLLYALKNGYGGRNYVPDDKFKASIELLQGIAGEMNSEGLKKIL